MKKLVVEVDDTLLNEFEVFSAMQGETVQESIVSYMSTCVDFSLMDDIVEDIYKKEKNVK